MHEKRNCLMTVPFELMDLILFRLYACITAVDSDSLAGYIA